jgi:hypothetical protein
MGGRGETKNSIEHFGRITIFFLNFSRLKLDHGDALGLVALVAHPFGVDFGR